VAVDWLLPACVFLPHKLKGLAAYSNPLLDGLHVAKEERYWTIQNLLLGSQRFYQGTSEAVDSKAAGLAPLPFLLRSI
jgi:hypothetical protein